MNVLWQQIRHHVTDLHAIYANTHFNLLFRMQPQVWGQSIIMPHMTPME